MIKLRLTWASRQAFSASERINLALNRSTSALVASNSGLMPMAKRPGPVPDEPGTGLPHDICKCRARHSLEVTVPFPAGPNEKTPVWSLIFPDRMYPAPLERYPLCPNQWIGISPKDPPRGACEMKSGEKVGRECQYQRNRELSNIA